MFAALIDLTTEVAKLSPVLGVFATMQLINSSDYIDTSPSVRNNIHMTTYRSKPLQIAEPCENLFDISALHLLLTNTTSKHSRKFKEKLK